MAGADTVKQLEAARAAARRVLDLATRAARQLEAVRESASNIDAQLARFVLAANAGATVFGEPGPLAEHLRELADTLALVVDACEDSDTLGVVSIARELDARVSTAN